MGIVVKSFLFANESHKGKIRKYNKGPYIQHPIRVSRLAHHHFANHSNHDNLVAIAYLHDTIEDCDVTRAQLETEFNKTVADGVFALTNPSKKHPELKRRDRKFLDRVHIEKLPIELKIIKAFDRIDNLCDMDMADDDFKKLYCVESLELLLYSLYDIPKDIKSDIFDIIKRLCI